MWVSKYENLLAFIHENSFPFVRNGEMIQDKKRNRYIGLGEKEMIFGEYRVIKKSGTQICYKNYRKRQKNFQRKKKRCESYILFQIRFLLN